jgi:hypothetical protein
VCDTTHAAALDNSDEACVESRIEVGREKQSVEDVESLGVRLAIRLRLDVACSENISDEEVRDRAAITVHPAQRAGGSMPLLIVAKIDLVGSKAYAQAHEKQEPAIRAHTLKKLLEVSRRFFPAAESPYPAGSFYKADGDAVTYILESPSVALRSSIEFMQTWYHEAAAALPECRVFLDYGSLDRIVVPGKDELTGKPFENISVFEKGLNPGHIYLTRDVIDAADKTMAKFVFQTQSSPRPGDTLRIFRVDFLDPRTVRDSGLLHALFVAHPKATEARERLFELFAVERLLETHEADIPGLIRWGREKGYPVPDSATLTSVVSRSSLIQQTAGDPPRFRIRDEARGQLDAARSAFTKSKAACINEVRDELASLVKINPTDEEVGALVEDYLCAIFSEIRMMANYFRSTGTLFSLGPDTFRRFDYVVRRHLHDHLRVDIEEARQSLVAAIKRCADARNEFIAAVFHNVLATYYLNRSTQASAYQEHKLRERRIFIDTNILYALKVAASNYHDLVVYFVERLAKLGVVLRMYPFSVEEYEHSLLRVEQGYRISGPADWIIRTNPWLYQEFKLNPGKYLDSISVCRQEHSVSSEPSIEPKSYDAVDRSLRPMGIELERTFATFTKEETETIWSDLRNAMTSSSWSLERYWDFIYHPRPENVIRHDVMYVENVRRQAAGEGADEVGPRVILLTVDSKLLRLRKRYDFILSPEQFLEFMLPYLFLADIPILEGERFPNQLLAAQLGTLLVNRPPELADIVAACLRNPSLLDRDVLEAFPQADRTARALNSDRLRRIIREGTGLSESDQAAVAKQTADLLRETERAQGQASEAKTEQQRLKEQLAAAEQRLEKLQRTVVYWREQARRKEN